MLPGDPWKIPRKACRRRRSSNSTLPTTGRPMTVFIFVNNLGGDVSKRYINFIEIKKRGITVGYIIIDLVLKRIIPDKCIPGIAGWTYRFLTPYQNANYSYAVFENAKVTYSSGDFNYLLDFDENFTRRPNFISTLFNGGRFLAYRG